MESVGDDKDMDGNLEAATGFEPVITILQTVALATWLRRLAKIMERETGFEPATSTLARLRSTS